MFDGDLLGSLVWGKQTMSLGLTSPFFPGILFLENHQKPWGNGWLLKRTMAEENGESTPRTRVAWFTTKKEETKALAPHCQRLVCEERPFRGGLASRAKNHATAGNKAPNLH